MRVISNRLAYGFLLWLGVFACAAVAEVVVPVETTLVIGREWTAVRAVYPVPLLIGPQKLELGGVPAAADLSSLLIRDPRVRLTVHSAERMQGVLGTDGDGMRMDSSTGTLLWNRNAGESPEKNVSGPVAVLLDSPVGGRRNLEVIYLTRGLSWTASYQLRTRGDLRSLEEERFSVDLAGFVEIENRTGERFDTAQLFLVGSESPVKKKMTDDPGFLALSESPLADLWKDVESPAVPENRYEVDGVHALACSGRLSIPILDAARISAEREYVMRSEEVPLAAKGAGRPLREVIRFPNVKNNGTGRPLPAGAVLIFRTGAMQYRMTTAWMSPAGIHELIRIDLGPDPEVVGYRSHLEHTEGTLNTYRERYGLRLVNAKNQPVQVVLYETPPTVLEWMVIRSGESYVKRGRTLEMRTPLEPKSERMIEYTLQIKQPGL